MGGAEGVLEWPSFKVNFKAAFAFPVGLLVLAYECKSPQETLSLTQKIELKYAGPGRGGPWRFVCPKQTHKNCVKVTGGIYFGEDRKFSCLLCSKVRSRRGWFRDEKVEFYMEWPMHIKKTLESPLAPVKDKIRALEAYGYLSVRLASLKRKIKNGKVYQMKGLWHKWRRHLPPTSQPQGPSGPPPPLTPPRQ